MAGKQALKAAAVCAAAALLLALIVRSSTPPRPGAAPAAVRTITDMAGRTVTIPARIDSVVTLGAVPVINGFLFAFGVGDRIANGLPEFARNARFRYQTVFAPSLAAKPRMQGAGREPDLELLNATAPDVAFTMDRETADILERSTAIPAIVLAWRQPGDVKQLVTLVGEIFDRPEVAHDYIQYFDETIRRVSQVVKDIPDAERPRVLFCTLRRLTQEQLISEWWIATAGGRSVTNATRATESYTFTLEQLFAWDPDILIVSSADDLRDINEDRRYQQLKAVRQQKVYVAPTGAHQWANRTIEQPLTVLWAARHFFPDRFSDVDLTLEMRAFYARFFRFEMTDAQAEDLLAAAQ